MALCCAIDLCGRRILQHTLPSIPATLGRSPGFQFPCKSFSPGVLGGEKGAPVKGAAPPPAGGSGLQVWQMGWEGWFQPHVPSSQLQPTSLQPLVQRHAMMGTSFSLETITQAGPSHMSAVMEAMAFTSSSVAGLPRKPILLIFAGLQIQPVASVLPSTMPGGDSPDSSQCGAATPLTHTTPQSLPQQSPSYPYHSHAALTCLQLSKASQQPSQDTFVGCHITPPLLALKNTPLANITSSSLKNSPLAPIPCPQHNIRCSGRRISRGDRMSMGTFLEEVLVAGSGGGRRDTKAH